MAELPYQSPLQKREVLYTSLIWYDQSIRTGTESGMLEQRFEHTPHKVCNTEEGILAAINESVKTVLIISGRDAAVLVPKLCEDHNGNGLSKVPNISGIIVFCRNEQAHKQWSSNYPIVTLVSSSIHQVFEEADRLL